MRSFKLAPSGGFKRSGATISCDTDENWESLERLVKKYPSGSSTRFEKQDRHVFVVN